MKSKLQEALALSLHPVAVLLAEEPPDGAARFHEGRWGCVMAMFATVAAQGRAAAFDRKTYGCWGGGVGLGFGNAYRDFLGGVECFARFLSTGNAGWERGRQVAEALPKGRGFAEQFLEGERYVASPELVMDFLQRLPMREVPTPYVVFKPLRDVDPGRETPSTVVFCVNPDQLSALVVLANAGREGLENVIMPYAASCQNVGILPLREGDSRRPRAVVGHTDISARNYARKALGRDTVTFAAPWALFREMEDLVDGSFLERESWRALLADREDGRR